MTVETFNNFLQSLAPAVLLLFAVVVAVWWAMWLIMPFFIYGIYRRTRRLQEESHRLQSETNRLLRALVKVNAPNEREESEATRNPFAK